MGISTAASGSRRAYWPLASLLAIAAVFVLAMLIATGGFPTYLLDDTWIHLQFSEQIVAGHFGLVPGEKASPASSILYPLLLTPLAGTALHQWQPAVWNLAGLIAVLLLWQRLFQRFVLGDVARRDPVAGLLALAAVIFTNTLWLAATGMEHVLQIAATLAVAVGLLELMIERRVRWFLLAGLILGPLLRLENFSITLPAAVALLSFGHWRLALAALAGSVGGVLIHGWISAAAGLPVLGGPTLLKGLLDDLVTAPLDTLDAMLQFIARTLRSGRSDSGHLVIGALLAISLPWHWRHGDRPTLWLTVIAIACLGAQFVLGGLLRVGRHEIYAQCFALAALAFAYRQPVQWAVRSIGAWQTAAAGALLMAALFPANLVWTATAPWAAQDIWRQQWQMRRFLLEHVRAPAAVNDVGLTAYRNPHFVLDLVGLGSDEVYRTRMSGTATKEFYSGNLRKHRIEAVLIYNEWFAGALPDNLERVAEFHLGRVPVATGGSVVTVYATSPETAQRLRLAAAEFAKSMPPGTEFKIVLRGGVGLTVTPQR